jgi:hypothetical protein
VENETDLTANLTEAIEAFGDALGNMSKALKECRSSGMTDIDMRDEIMKNLPESDHAAFMAQWPMISMMFAML